MKNDKSRVLELLRADSRYGAEKIAVMLGIGEEEVKNIIQELEESGVIVKYSAITNGGKLEGESVEALIEVKVTPQHGRGFDAIAGEISRFSEVKNLYLMSGGFDIAVFIEGKTLRDVAMFVSEKLSMTENVISTATHFILKKYKIEGIVTDESENGKRMPFQP